MSGEGTSSRGSLLKTLGITIALVAVFFVYAGDAPPNVNEAHYLVKAKNFWNPDWCQNDLFTASGKAHAFFYWTFGWPTLFVSFSTTAWIGRIVGWLFIAFGLCRLTQSLKLPAELALVIGIVWIAGIERGNLAGEWVVGGIEAKVPAYGLVLLGISELVNRRWERVWLYFGAASAFHVLTGGWSVVAGWIAFVLTERFGKKSNETQAAFFTPALLIGGALSLLGLIPALQMSDGATPAETLSAAKTYTYFRISHHLLPSALHFDWYLRHGLITIATVAVLVLFLRRAKADHSDAVKSLLMFAVGAMSISAVGLIVGIVPAFSPDWGARLLRVYWFRLADAITPLALACGVASWMHWGMQRSLKTPLVCSTIAVVASLLMIGQTAWHNTSGGVPISVSNRLLGLDASANYATQRQTMADWIKVCRFVRANTDEDAILLTPRHQQTFKWYAHRAEVVNWKDIPQDVLSLREWSRRFVEIFPVELSTMRVTIRYDRLRHFRKRYDVDWMIVDRRVVGPQLPLVQVYPLAGESEQNETYAIYRLPALVGNSP